MFQVKRRLVFPKTTYRFPQNNVSFSLKQRVVFYKTTYRFLVVARRRRGREKLNCENTCNHRRSRVRVYTYSTGVFVFLLSQVSQPII